MKDLTKKERELLGYEKLIINYILDRKISFINSNNPSDQLGNVIRKKKHDPKISGVLEHLAEEEVLGQSQISGRRGYLPSVDKAKEYLIKIDSRLEKR